MNLSCRARSIGNCRLKLRHAHHWYRRGGRRRLLQAWRRGHIAVAATTCWGRYRWRWRWLGWQWTPDTRWLIMLVQVGLQGKGLVTSRTLKVFWRRMCLHVGPEVGPISKRLFAHRTRVGLVAGVWPHVTLEKPRSRKCLATNGTPMTQVVCQNVHGECRHGHIHLPANVTLLGIGRIQAAMGLLVSREVGAGGIILATFSACVFWLVFRGGDGTWIFAFLCSTVDYGQSHFRWVRGLNVKYWVTNLLLPHFHFLRVFRRGQRILRWGARRLGLWKGICVFTTNVAIAHTAVTIVVSSRGTVGCGDVNQSVLLTILVVVWSGRGGRIGRWV